MKTTIALLILILEFIFINPAQAMKIVNVKNGKVMIDTEGATVNIDDQILAFDGNGKKRGRIIIKKIKGDKALGEIDKGSVQTDYTLEASNGGGGSDKSRGGKSSASNSGGSSGKRSAWGVLGGLSSNSMTVKRSSGSVAMTGNSFSLLGFYQIPMDGNISVRGSSGYQTLSANGNASLATGTDCLSCSIEISYLGFNAVVRYTLVKSSSMEFTVGAGLGILLALSKSSNAVDTSKITTNQTLNVVLGLDYYLGNKKNFIPIEFNYGIFPSTNTSEASQMTLTAGYGWNF